jgi:hypothetical protein
MDSLGRKTNFAAIRRSLEDLPTGVNDTYQQAMKRIDAQPEDDKLLARHILSWIAYARRELSVKELQHALAVRPEMMEMNLDAIDDDEVLTSVCAGLVVINEKHSIIHLVRKYPIPPGDL